MNEQSKVMEEIGRRAHRLQQSVASGLSGAALQLRIEQLCLTVRNQALEEAAKVAEKHSNKREREGYEDDGLAIAEAIRALKEKS